MCFKKACDSSNHSTFRFVLLRCDIITVVMGDIEIFAYDNHHLKYHGYCKYHDTSKIVVTVHKH